MFMEGLEHLHAQALSHGESLGTRRKGTTVGQLLRSYAMVISPMDACYMYNSVRGQFSIIKWEEGVKAI